MYVLVRNVFDETVVYRTDIVGCYSDMTHTTPMHIDIIVHIGMQRSNLMISVYLC